MRDIFHGTSEKHLLREYIGFTLYISPADIQTDTDTELSYDILLLLCNNYD